MPSVLQDWVMDLPLLMQSALISATRGPDSPYVPKVKDITRWIRGLVFIPADPANVVGFMQREMPDRIYEHTTTHKQFEATPQHFAVHLKQALEVIGYKYPHPEIRGRAYALYTDLCFAQGHPPESPQAFQARLANRVWPNMEQPQTAEEAFIMVKTYGKFSDHDKRLLKEED